MTPFEEFRLWLRQGATFERAIAGVAAVIVLGLVAWVLVPADNVGRRGAVVGSSAAAAGGDSPQSPVSRPTLAGSEPSSSGPEVPTGAAGATGPVAASSASSEAASPTANPQNRGTTAGSAAATDPCASRTATDQGVTADTITIAVVIIDISGGNSILGVPEPDEQRRENQGVIDALNAKGGLRCRKIVPNYYRDNPLDANSEHAVCLQIVAAKVFAVIGGLYQPQNATCLPQNKLPTYTQTIRPTTELRKFSPYLFSFYSDSDTLFRSYVAGAKQQGFFDGMNKLGVVLQSCYPEYNDQLLKAIGRAGIPSNKLSTFNFGCAAGTIPVPTAVSGAVFQFRRDGVDRVMTAGANISSFSSQAQGQGYRPRYAVTGADTTLELTASAGFQPNPQNFDGALGISNTQYGATNTPGVALSPETAACNAMLTKGGAQKATDGIGYAGGVCNQWKMLELGAAGGATLTRAALAAGLNKVGLVQQSYPGAPALWNDPVKTWAGPHWRPVRYVGSCNCWKVISADFRTASV